MLFTLIKKIYYKKIYIYLFNLSNVKFSNWVGYNLFLSFVCVLPVVFNILSTGDEDGTKQNIAFAISLKIGYSFSFTLKKSNGPYFANESLSVDEKEETSYFGAS
jgi:hypothetical protein